MKIFLLTVVLFYSSDLYSQTNADSIAIVKLLQSDYVALGKADIKTHIQNCTEDYMLIENGEIWDLRKEVEYMKSQIGLKTIRNDQFNIKTLHIENSFAYVVYELKSDISTDGVTKKYQWTESAIFQKISGDWKLNLIHSTTTKD
jgi:hypothetical protein